MKTERIYLAANKFARFLSTLKKRHLATGHLIMAISNLTQKLLMGVKLNSTIASSFKA